MTAYPRPRLVLRLWLVGAALVFATGQARMQVLPPSRPEPVAPAGTPATRHAEEGRPLVRLYPPAEYGGGAQNWAFVQDARGVIYVGSGGGVLEFDGITWRLIETPLRQTVRSLAIAADGRIYVGSVSDLGYLAPDATGTLAFVSLHDKIAAEAQRYGDVWRTFALPDGVYFQTDSAIFRYAETRCGSGSRPRGSTVRRSWMACCTSRSRTWGSPCSTTGCSASCRAPRRSGRALPGRPPI